MILSRYLKHLFKGAVTLCDLSRDEFILKIAASLSETLHGTTFLSFLSRNLGRGWDLILNSEFLLVAQQKCCETGCKRNVTLCNG